MKNNPAKEEDTKTLQNLDIENNKIRCTDCCTLQVLIGYVNLLLQLYPELKENVKRALSSRYCNLVLSG
jgi:hypothetical protein